MVRSGSQLSIRYERALTFRCQVSHLHIRFAVKMKISATSSYKAKSLKDPDDVKSFAMQEGKLCHFLET